MSINCAVLPLNIISPDGKDGKGLLQAMGVKFSGALNDYLVRVVLPPNLSIKLINPRLHVLIDEKRRHRANVIIGESFRDKPHVELLRRFCITLDCKSIGGQDQLFGIVFDGTAVIHTTTGTGLTSNRTQRMLAAKNSIELAKEWLGVQYPNWQSPSEYWD